jgi:5'-nucleotidase / UDP-sugar diphosphatase
LKCGEGFPHGNKRLSEVYESMTHRPRRSSIICLTVALLWLLAPALSANAAEKLKLTIIHLNDVHTHYIPYKEKDSDGLIGGIAKAGSVVADLEAGGRADGREVLKLFAGDLLTGTPFSSAFKGQMGVRLLNELKFEAMTVGNHEFDYGQGNLLQNMKPLMAFPLLSANIRNKAGKYPFEQVTIKQYPSAKTRVVIFGLTTTETPTATLPANVKGLVFDGAIKTAGKVLAGFKDDDLIIALTHLGVDEDRKLAAACPKIDVIIGGHSHTAIEKPLKVNNTIICQAGAYAKYVGRLNLDVEDGRVVRHDGGLVLLGSEVTEDPKIGSIVSEYQAKMDTALKTVIGRSDVFLEGTRSAVRSGRATNLGTLIAYNMAATVRAEVALLNGGAIRGSIAKGDVTLSDIETVLPFSDTLVKMGLTGEEIASILQRSVDLAEGSGGKLQTFGVDWGLERGKIRIEKIHGQRFRAAKRYSVATNNFLATGGDGYDTFKNKGRNSCDTLTPIADILQNYIRSKKIITPEVLDGIK